MVAPARMQAYTLPAVLLLHHLTTCRMGDCLLYCQLHPRHFKYQTLSAGHTPDNVRRVHEQPLTADAMHL
jgi:hypothetical protein